MGPGEGLATLGLLGSFLLIFGIIMLILAFLLPLFVLRIRKELISMNIKMSQIIILLGEKKKQAGIDTLIEVCPHDGYKKGRDKFSKTEDSLSNKIGYKIGCLIGRITMPRIKW